MRRERGHLARIWFLETGMQTLPTYRLVPKDGGPNIEGKHYFFWTSGSSFERALSLNPWMKSMTHFCGPGNTQLMLQRTESSRICFLITNNGYEKCVSTGSGSDRIDAQVECLIRITLPDSVGTDT